ncbi:MAG TPA: hypothetical protein VGO93_08150 [Candidatus Xenobia bacterium]
MHLALDNLRKRSGGAPHQVKPGLYYSRWHDSFDATRLMLTDIWSELSVKGDVVARLVDPNTVWVTGSHDAENLQQLISQTPSATLNPYLLVLKEGTWSPCQFPREHLLWVGYRKMVQKAQQRDYAEQSGFLQSRKDVL